MFGDQTPCAASSFACPYPTLPCSSYQQGKQTGQRVIQAKPVSLSIEACALWLLMSIPAACHVHHDISIYHANTWIYISRFIDLRGGSQVMAANLLVLAHVTEAAKGGTAPQMAVAIRKYRKFKLMLACTQQVQQVEQVCTGRLV